MSDILSKLREVQQKKLDVLFKDVCVLARIYLPALSQVLNARVDGLQASLILVAHSARPVDLDSVIKDFVRFNDQRKDDFAIWTAD